MSKFKEPSTSIWLELSSFCVSSMDKGPFAKLSLPSESWKEDCNSVIPSTPTTSLDSAPSWSEIAISFPVTEMTMSEQWSSARAPLVSTWCKVSASGALTCSSGGAASTLPSCPRDSGSSEQGSVDTSCVWQISGAHISFSSPKDLGVLLFISDKLYRFHRRLLLDFQEENKLHNPLSKSCWSVSWWSLVTFCTHLRLIFLNLQVLPLARSFGNFMILYRNLTIESFLCIINKNLFFTVWWLNLDLFRAVKGPQVPFHSLCNSISFYSCLKLPGLCCPHHYCSPPHYIQNHLSLQVRQHLPANHMRHNGYGQRCYWEQQQFKILHSRDLHPERIHCWVSLLLLQTSFQLHDRDRIVLLSRVLQGKLYDSMVDFGEVSAFSRTSAASAAKGAWAAAQELMCLPSAPQSSVQFVVI